MINEVFLTFIINFYLIEFYEVDWWSAALEC